MSAANNLLAAALDARMFHENTQTDKALYRRLVPTIKGEVSQSRNLFVTRATTDCYPPTRQRYFTPIMKRRLVKLGIDPEIDPKDMSDEDVSRFVRLDVDPVSIFFCFLCLFKNKRKK